MPFARTVYLGGILSELVIVLILFIPGGCEYLMYNVDIGDTLRQSCIRPDKLPDEAVVTRVNILHQLVWKFRVEHSGVTQSPSATKYDHWRVAYENVSPSGASERNAHKFSVTITIAKAKTTDTGLLACRLFYHEEGQTRSRNTMKEVAFFYVQNEGHAPCKGKWVYYEPNRLCYKAFYRSKTWLEAKSYCADVHNGSLIDVPDSKSSAFIFAVMDHSEDTPFWIGLNDRDKEGDFRWADGTPPKLKLFAPGHPVTDTEKNCVEKGFHGSGRWSVLNCEEENYFLCQAKPEELSNYNYGEDDGTLSHREIMLIFLGVATATLLTVLLFLLVDQESFEKCVFCESDDDDDDDDTPPPFFFA